MQGRIPRSRRARDVPKWIGPLFWFLVVVGLALTIAILAMTAPQSIPIPCMAAIVLASWYGDTTSGLLAVGISTVLFGVVLEKQLWAMAAVYQLMVFLVISATLSASISFVRRSFARLQFQNEQARLLLGDANQQAQGKPSLENEVRDYTAVGTSNKEISLLHPNPNAQSEA